MRLTRRTSMPCSPVSYRFEENGVFVTAGGYGTGVMEVVEKLGRYEDLGYEPEELERILKEKKTYN